MSANASKLHAVRVLLLKIRESPCGCQAAEYASEALKLIPSTRPEGAVNDHAWMIDLFCRLWNEKRGSRYLVQGAKDGAAVKRLLATGVERGEIERRIRVALEDPFFARAGSIALFVSGWNGYDGYGRTAPGTAQTVRKRFI